MASMRKIGLALHAYQMQRRINFAKNLIQCGRPLEQVAADSGFADQSHMSRHFRACLGIPPGRFKLNRYRTVSRLPGKREHAVN